METLTQILILGSLHHCNSTVVISFQTRETTNTERQRGGGGAERERDGKRHTQTDRGGEEKKEKKEEETMLKGHKRTIHISFHLTYLRNLLH